MLEHADIWRAIDRLAAAHGYSPSGLARRAGLDPTTFNRSKRRSRDGRPRWPSTESIAKILAATGTRFSAFVASMDETDAAAPRIPLIAYAEAGAPGLFDRDGLPLPRDIASAWDGFAFPGLADPHAYALRVGGDALAPIYRDGDTLLVSPHAPVRAGDRIVLRRRDGTVLARELAGRDARHLALRPLAAPSGGDLLAPAEIAFVHRILWASQ
jgi:phage repressor protein C with HTH and peptisase S24 domain